MQKHEPRVTSQAATPLQVVFREKQPGRGSGDGKFPPPATEPARRAGHRKEGGFVHASGAGLNQGPVGVHHGGLPLFLLPAASFLDIIAVHVSPTAADWLLVWDQLKVTAVKLDRTADALPVTEEPIIRFLTSYVRVI